MQELLHHVLIFQVKWNHLHRGRCRVFIKKKKNGNYLANTGHDGPYFSSWQVWHLALPFLIHSPYLFDNRVLVSGVFS